MSKPTILVTGATGKVGFATATYLLQQKGAVNVKVFVRSRSTQAEALQSLGAILVFGDMNSPVDMAAAFKGCDRAFCLPPFSHHSLMATTVFLTQAKEAKLKHIVLLSQWLAAESAPDVLSKQHWLMEKQFEQSGLSYTIIAPGFFADNYLNYGFLRMACNIGMYGGVMNGETQNCPPSNEDIGSCCGAALLDPVKYNGKRFRPTGPTLLSVLEMTEIISSVVNSKLTYRQLPLFLILQTMAYQNMDPFIVHAFLGYCVEADKGGFSAGGPTNHVKLLTGRDPESFEVIVKRYAGQPQNMASFGNKMKTIRDLMLASFCWPYNLARIARQQQLPIEAKPLFAGENATWKSDRVDNITNKVYPAA